MDTRSTQNAPPSHAAGPNPATGAQVPITLNGASVQIHRGRQSVAAIKAAGSIPATYELAIDEGSGTPTPLADDGSVTIKGGEVFIAYPRDAASS